MDHNFNDCIRHLITCTCGLTRALPVGVKEGDRFSLVPCPRCGSPLHGRFLGDTVEAFQTGDHE